jgi:hypothetical protein
MRSNAFVYNWYAITKGAELAVASQSSGCHGNVASLSVRDVVSGALTVMFGRWTDSSPTHPPFNETSDVALDIQGLEPGSCWHVGVEWVANSDRAAGVVKQEPSFNWSVPALATDDGMIA